MSGQRDWSPFALLLIDVQRDFWDDRLAERFPDFPTNVARLLDLCRSEGIEVIHLRASFKPDQSDWMPRYRLRGRIPCVEGTPRAETLPFALPGPAETVIVKHTFDGFCTSDLLPYLRRRAKGFILAAGLVTSTCVLFTAVSAMQSGFLAAVVDDCCADEPRAHKDTLDRCQFIFEHTSVARILERRSEWIAALERLEGT
jgi:nicotinamidase-related amidase